MVSFKQVMTSHLTPLLKAKVDELFLRWFSEPETQIELRKYLAQIRADTLPSESLLSAGSSAVNINSRPSSPPVPPSSPTFKSPRSPRRRSNSTPGRPRSRKNLTPSFVEEKKEDVYAGCAQNLPQFYFPFGRPVEKNQKIVLNQAKDIFSKIPSGKLKLDGFGPVAKACKYSLYWKYPLYHACGGSKKGFVTFDEFAGKYEKLTQKCHDDASLLFCMLCKDNQKYLTGEDFEPLLQDIINTHPGLQFLLEAPEFHSRYIITVISRIFYCINKTWTGKITLSEFKRSNFVQVLNSLEEEEDINQIIDYFSYEHFYVIYCKFWELDTDHDLIIDKQDLGRYCNGALSPKMVDRIFSGCVTRGKSHIEGKMSYADFVWFIISEVDKTSPTSIEYWFRCMDLNGDGMISMYELEFFYQDQLNKMEEMGMEPLSFIDCLCQMLDMMKPAANTYVTLRDLKHCKMTPIFLDTFFNLDKWLEHEQKDPFQASRNEDGSESEYSAWDRYAAEEYELLVAEEGANDDFDYEDDFELDDDYANDDFAVSKQKSAEDSVPKWSVVAGISDGGNHDGDDKG